MIWRATISVGCPGSSRRRHAVTGSAHIETKEHAYYYLNTLLDKKAPDGRWAGGPSFDGRHELSVKEQPEPLGEEPELGKVREYSNAQKEQMQLAAKAAPVRFQLANVSRRSGKRHGDGI